MTEKQSTLSKPEIFVLYSLGQCYRRFSNRFTNKPLAVTISKSVFIDILISSKSAHKKSRALYKNLESLEKKKYIKYKNKELSFTKKGFKIFNDINKSVGEYLDIIQHIHSPKIVKLHKKLQTKLKNFNK